MFAHTLSEDDRLALVGTLAFLARADGELSGTEQAFIVAVSERLNLDPRKVLASSEARTLKEILEPVTALRAKRIIIQELVNLGHADGDYCDSDKRGIRTVAALLGVDTATVERLETWVDKGIEWTRDGVSLIEGGI